MTSSLPPADGHEWWAFEDESGDRWMFDVTWLESGFGCIWGRGCRTIAADDETVDPAAGCCLHGAHLSDDADRERVADAAARLTPEHWQHARLADRRGGPMKRLADGSWATRVVDGACIFLNGADFPGGAGCALHAGAAAADERPLDWKPDVCWQVPIRFDVHTDDNDRDTVFVRPWERPDWGPGGAEFAWWCIDDPDAYREPEPAYLTLADELTELVGADHYDRLRRHLDDRAGSGTPVRLRAVPDRRGPTTGEAS